MINNLIGYTRKIVTKVKKKEVPKKVYDKIENKENKEGEDA